MKVKFRAVDGYNLDSFGGIRIWEQPKFGHTYAIGADVAEGVNKDASCAQVLDCNSGKHVACYWSNTIDLDNYSAELYKLGSYYFNAYICIELNNHGFGVVSLLGGSRGGLSYPNLYKRLTFDEYTQKQTKKVGFKTTQQTKPRIIENLKSALRDGEISTQDKYTIQELGSYVRDIKTGRIGASSSAHDDRVMALALAWEQARLLNESLKYVEKSERSPFSDGDTTTTQYDPETGFRL